MVEFEHKPVLLKECIDGLNIKPNGIYVDCTLGGAGHSEEIAKRLSSGKLIAIDKDSDAIQAAKERLTPYNVEYINDDFKNVLKSLPLADGILMDLGVSSYQIDTPSRGFSYRFEGSLDMRMDRRSNLTAEKVVNEYSETELIKIFFEYGEERFSKRIAHNIVTLREKNPIKSTAQLVKVIEDSIPAKYKWSGGHPAKRTFQAIRIEVNNELKGLDLAVSDAARGLVAGGRLCIIAFHSLEDRIIKNAFRYLASDCVCDKNVPICVCDKISEVNILTKKPITASDAELTENKRAESAKLRIIEKK